MVRSRSNSPTRLRRNQAGKEGHGDGWADVMKRTENNKASNSRATSRTASSHSVSSSIPQDIRHVFQGQSRKLEYTPDICHEVLMGNMQRIKSCVERFGCDVNQCGHDGLTPMHVAAAQGDMAVCKYLVAKGGDIFGRSNDGYTPLHLAARAGHLDVLKMFKDSDGFYVGDIDIRTYDQWSSLHFACRDGRRNIFHYLVHETDRSAAIVDVDLDARTGDGRSPLLIAAEVGDARMVDELVGMGCNSAVHCVRHGHTRMTALHLAALAGNEEVVKCLALMGEDVDAVTGGGWTPIMLAAHAGKEGVAKILVNAGADLRAKTAEKHDTALDLAKRKGHKGIEGMIAKELAMSGGQ